jgi:hypothetical protein
MGQGTEPEDVVTTTADRDDRTKVGGATARRVERPVPSARPRTDRSKLVMLVNVVLIAGVAIIGLTQVRGQESPDAGVASDPTAGPASTLPEPDATPSGLASQPASTDLSAGQPPASDPPASTPPGATAVAPVVKPRMRSNFAKGDPWPVGAGFRETGRMAWPLGVVDRLMTHGAPRSADAVSWLEKWMKTDVRTIGARVLFAPNHSGGAAITAWHTSVLDTSGLQQPRTGMRLVVAPGTWKLMALDGNGASVLSSGTYKLVGRSATFNMVRRESTLWLTDPEGLVTRVDDPRIGSLSGPWASWELRDDTPDRRPAGFQEIWAG